MGGHDYRDERMVSDLWEMLKPIGGARIGKLDPRLLHVGASLAQRVGHALDHPERLLANGEIDEQNPGACCAHARYSLVYRRPRWQRGYRRLGQEASICQRWGAKLTGNPDQHPTRIAKNPPRTSTLRHDGRSPDWGLWLMPTKTGLLSQLHCSSASDPVGTRPPATSARGVCSDQCDRSKQGPNKSTGVNCSSRPRRRRSAPCSAVRGYPGRRARRQTARLLRGGAARLV